VPYSNPFRKTLGHVRCEQILPSGHQCGSAAKTPYEGGEELCQFHSAPNARNEEATLEDFAKWLDGLMDASILFTGRYAQERRES
jgi:hypothetical protein